MGLSEVNVIAVDPSGKLLRKASLDLGKLCMVHDSLMSANYFILAISPYDAGFGDLFMVRMQ